MACKKQILVGICCALTVVVNATDRDTTLQAFSTFPVGAYLAQKHMTNSQYVLRATHEYGSMTTGAMKMTNIRPTQDSFAYELTDYWIAFAQEHNLRLHGHTLVWGSVPDWVKSFEGDSVAWEKLLKEQIQTVVTHYKDQVHSWDVVNEAMGDDGNLKKDNIWYQHLGPGYVERAFRYAHEADTTALLFYNDYGHEYSYTRLNAIVDMITRFKRMKVPVHGIGMQMHTRYNLGDARWKDAINACASTGLLIHISELDISVNSSPCLDDAVFTPELERAQADKYEVIFKAYCQIPKQQQYGITMWGVGDKDTWIRGEKKRKEWPLPFDDNYNRKKAYYGILKGLGGQFVPTDIDTVDKKMVDHVEYFTMMGVLINDIHSYHGFVIKRSVFIDQTQQSDKIYIAQ